MADTPSFENEKSLIEKGHTYIVGVDEVGRGPWAGPVVAAAVRLDPNNLPFGVTDSKKLSEKKRRAFLEMIQKTADVSIAEASVEEIDKMNIREATFLAMERAVAGLPKTASYIFVDGNALPKNLNSEAETVIKGDLKVMSIAAASVVAKVYRDDLMQTLSEQFPHYGWERNAGYGVKKHQEGLAEYGVTVHHRRSFKPIREMVTAS